MIKLLMNPKKYHSHSKQEINKFKKKGKKDPILVLKQETELNLITIELSLKINEKKRKRSQKNQKRKLTKFFKLIYPKKNIINDCIYLL